MRTLSTLAFLFSLTYLTAKAQPLGPLAPPMDPQELVTGDAQIVTTAEQRAAVVELMGRAVDRYSMHAKTSPAHVLQIAFTATASTSFPAGSGQLRETWISGQNWRWDATLGNYSLLRISSNGVAYDQQGPRPVPLRLKMISNAVLAPIQSAAPRASVIRTASVSRNGTQLTCILLSFPGGQQINAQQNTATAPTGRRQWDETEYCIDPVTGLLNVFSEVPGMQVFYDYSNALKFHDRTLPGSVTISESGSPVVQAQLTSIEGTNPTDVTPFTPTAQMKALGPAIQLFLPTRMRHFIRSTSIQPGSLIESSIVHVTMDEKGNVLESENLQTSSLSAQALEAVTHNQFFALALPPGAPPREREAYVRVEFVPAAPQAGWNFVHKP